MNSKTWDDVWNGIVANPTIKLEYKKAFLLNMFQKICSRMAKDDYYRKHVLALFRQTGDTFEVTKTIISKEFNYTLDDEEAILLHKWFMAYRKKSSHRKAIPLSTKKQLYIMQQGLCAACGQQLGSDWSKIHVDHIVPWVLVGDELEDNYQDLCETCNECKSSKTDYIFKNLISLV